ncbi:hypothetical protein M011DRAFT_514677 [Sporormia fimetaria CBS 119925]|uniref:Uncharacterized protein n=1 Tax=Sporormia fimetaria CBS 119925 TaxID=1340428 RepID=A0A6A6VHI1_9PLEO|nr:hypothetical protein M011DRAFT_514677 [Sporormia fimetaria CBS 119925]
MQQSSEPQSDEGQTSNNDPQRTATLGNMKHNSNNSSTKQIIDDEVINAVVLIVVHQYARVRKETHEAIDALRAQYNAWRVPTFHQLNYQLDSNLELYDIYEMRNDVEMMAAVRTERLQKIAAWNSELRKRSDLCQQEIQQKENSRWESFRRGLTGTVDQIKHIMREDENVKERIIDLSKECGDKWIAHILHESWEGVREKVRALLEQWQR